MMRWIACLFAVAAVGVGPASAQGWGAIATSNSNGAWGYGNNYATSDAASERAHSECAKFAWDCHVRQTFRNTCAILARGSNNAFGWSWGGTESERARRAVAECVKNKGEDCVIVTRFCTGQ